MKARRRKVLRQAQYDPQSPWMAWNNFMHRIRREQKRGIYRAQPEMGSIENFRFIISPELQ